MMTFESGRQEPSDDAKWERYLGELKQFLHDESTTHESWDGVETESQDGGHPAAEILEDIESGEFERASQYLEEESAKAHEARGIATDPKEVARLEVRLSRLQKLQEGLGRE